MTTLDWEPEADAADQLAGWCRLASTPGVVWGRFADPSDAGVLGWHDLEPWTRSRAVTVAEVASTLAGPARDVALCADLVVIRPTVDVVFDAGEAVTDGLLWAFGRAGRTALAKGLLDPTPITADEAVRLGLAHRILDDGPAEEPMVGVSLVALTTARDLMRAPLQARPALERAAFRLLFASGHPGEGARAFFDRRPPSFER